MSQVVPRFDFRVGCAACEALGNTRDNQEDVHLVAPELGLFVVADGMGGHAAGEVAARLAVDRVREVLGSREAQLVVDAYATRPGLKTRQRVLRQLERAVHQAHEAVVAAAEEDSARRGMGCTLDVVWLARDRAFVAHVGDSRVYLARPTTVLQLTQDHCEGDRLRATGIVKPTLRHVWGFERLVNVVGIGESISVDILFVDVDRGDRLLLCTDGVHGPVGDEARLSELLRSGTTEQAAHGLVDAAVARGRDNATAIVIQIGDCLVKRASADRGLAADDVQRARQSVLLVDLPEAALLGALAAAVEIELADGVTVPRVVANDLVAYIVLDGMVRCDDDRAVTTGALLFAESLAGVWSDAALPVVERAARLLRIRADDFQEVCVTNPRLGMELYRRVATHLARAVIGVRPLVAAVTTRPPAPAPDAPLPEIPSPPATPQDRDPD